MRKLVIAAICLLLAGASYAQTVDFVWTEASAMKAMRSLLEKGLAPALVSKYL